MNLVSLVRVEKYPEIKDGLKEALNLICYKLPTHIRNVVIKPNMCYYWDYTTGQTTDPNFVAAIIDIIREQVSPDVDISIVESDASAMKCRYAFRLLGYERLAQKRKVKLVNLSEDDSETIEVKAGEQTLRLELPRSIQQADLKINVPKIKYMEQPKISCALKNIYGCNPYPRKYKFHSILDETIVALNKIMKFDLHILDGTIVAGNPSRKLDLIMASQDPVAFDAVAAKIANINPKSVRHIVMAAREGLGNLNYIPKGESLQTFSAVYPRKTRKSKFLAFAYKTAIKTGLLKVEMI